MNHGSPERGDRRHSPSNLVRVPKVLSEIMYENQAARTPMRPTTAAARVGARAEISALTREVSGSPARRRKGKQDTGQQELNASRASLEAAEAQTSRAHEAAQEHLAELSQIQLSHQALAEAAQANSSQAAQAELA